MNSISEYIIAIFELVEAEGRTLKQQVIKVFIAFIFIIMFCFLVLSSYVLLVFGLYEYLTSFMSNYKSAFILSGLSLLFALVTFGVVKWKA